jgi:hypothetical protein
MNFTQLFNILLAVLPQLAQALETVAKSRGLPIDHPDVAQAIADHLTPGAPAAPELN